MGFVYLVRHGQASFGQPNYDQLSEVGLKQARLIGEHLRDAGQRFATAYCGDMERQRQTAQAALERLSDPPRLQVLPQFNECDYAPIIKALKPVMRQQDPEITVALETMYTDRHSFLVVFQAAMMHWITGRHDNGRFESWRQFRERVAGGLDHVRRENGPGNNALVFTSGGPISTAMGLVLGMADDEALKLTKVIKNASLTGFRYQRGEASLDLFNSTAHLERHGEEGLVTYL